MYIYIFPQYVHNSQHILQYDSFHPATGVSHLSVEDFAPVEHGIRRRPGSGLGIKHGWSIHHLVQ